jgi:hypothetical protein
MHIYTKGINKILKLDVNWSTNLMNVRVKINEIVDNDFLYLFPVNLHFELVNTSHVLH